jgi:hypothetical protein
MTPVLTDEMRARLPEADGLTQAAVLWAVLMDAARADGHDDDAAADLVGRTLSRWLADWRAANPQAVTE